MSVMWSTMLHVRHEVLAGLSAGRVQPPLDLKHESSGKLLAATDIPADTFSEDLELTDLVKTPKGDVQVQLNSMGRVEAERHSGSSVRAWVRAARIAGDCHSANIRLQRGRRRSCVLVRTLRHLSAGDELTLWFSEELLEVLRVPSFLAPANIQGNRRYVCHRCNALFELPNPLKIHLALDCGREGGEEALWGRLQPLSTPTPAPLTSFPSLPPPVPLPLGSAFSPWSPRSPAMTLRPPLPLPLPQAMPGAAASELNAQHARMESIVSSLGRSKRGHLCLYCGKLYSRKYGLKIHIRTHTGYKPLSCKFCLRPFGDPSNLNKHVRLHAEGETPYRCEQCGKVLVRRRDLERHLKARHGDAGGTSACQGVSTDEDSA